MALSIANSLRDSLQCISQPFAALAEHSPNKNIWQPLTGFAHVARRLGNELFSNPQMQRQVDSVTEQGTVLLNFFKRVPSDFAEGWKEMFCGSKTDNVDHESHVGSNSGASNSGAERADDASGTENRLLIARVGDFFTDKKLSKPGSDAPIFQRFMRGYRNFYHSPVGQLLVGNACRVLKPILCGLELGVRTAILLASASRIPLSILGRLAASTVVAAVSFAFSTVVAAALVAGTAIVLGLGIALAPIYLAFLTTRGIIEFFADGVKRDFTNLKNKLTASEGGEGVQRHQDTVANTPYAESMAGSEQAANASSFEPNSLPQSGGYTRVNPADLFVQGSAQSYSGSQHGDAPAPASAPIEGLSPVANAQQTPFSPTQSYPAAGRSVRIFSDQPSTSDVDLRGATDSDSDAEEVDLRGATSFNPVYSTLRVRTTTA